MLNLNKIEKTLKFLTSTSDDLVDKVYIRTSISLIVCAIVIGTVQNFGKPIQCILDPSFTSGWSAYVESYCFVSGTFILKGDMEKMPTVGVHSPEDLIYIGYYQWVPSVLVLMAFVLYVPHFSWNIMQRFSDIDFNFFVDECIKLKGTDKAKDRKEISKHVVDQLFLIAKRRFVRKAGYFSGSTGFLAYYASKALSMLMVVSQMIFLYHFVGRRDFFWGYNVAYDGLNSVHWNTTNFFPRVSFCTFRHNRLGGHQDHTAQCLLMMNMLNEKVFAVLYFWYWALIVITAANMLYIFCAMRNRFMTASDTFNPDFLRDVFGLDGEILLYFVRNKTNRLYVSSMMTELYDLCAEQGYVEGRKKSPRAKAINYKGQPLVRSDDRSEEEKDTRRFLSPSMTSTVTPTAMNLYYGYKV